MMKLFETRNDQANRTDILKECHMEQMRNCIHINYKCQQKLKSMNGNLVHPALTRKMPIATLKKLDYLNMKDSLIKQMLLATSNHNDDSIDFIVQSLDTTEKWNFIRQYAQLTHHLYCLKYEQDLWHTYYNISSLANIWSTTPITKEMAHENHLYRYLFTTRINIEKYLKKLIEQRMKIQYKLHEFLQQQQQINNLSFDINILLKLITTLVYNKLHDLRTLYETKAILFQYDANDYRLVKLFYDLKPSNDQIYSAKYIWQLTVYRLKMEEQLFKLKNNLSFLKHSTNTIETSSTLKHVEKERQLKYNLLIQSAIKSIQETIGNYKKIIYNEKKKILNEQKLNPSSGLFHSMNTIELRQNNMHERAQYFIKY